MQKNLDFSMKNLPLYIKFYVKLTRPISDADDKAIALKQYTALMAAQTAGAFVKLGQNTASANKFTLEDTETDTAQIDDVQMAVALLGADNDATIDLKGKDVQITMNAAGPTTANVEAGASLTFFVPGGLQAGAVPTPGSVTLQELSQLLTVKAKGDTYKATTPNPKCEILHMSLDSNNVVTVQVSEPIMLSTWQHNFAVGPSDYGLFLTVSPDWRKTLLFDHSGQYGCGSDGAIINGSNSSLEGLPSGGTSVNARQIYCQVKSVELHVGYVHPSEPYIPPSQSIRYSPIQVTRRKVEGTSLAETFVVPPSTKSVMIFLEQDTSHVCIDAELDSKAGAGINVLGSTDTTGTGDSTADRTGAQHSGTFLFDSNDIFDSRPVDRSAPRQDRQP